MIDFIFGFVIGGVVTFVSPTVFSFMGKIFSKVKEFLTDKNAG